MAPTPTECTLPSYEFGRLSKRKVVADFSGGDITSDGGLLLIRDIDDWYQISERLSACFTDQREARRVQHDLKTLIAQRLYGLVQGYEDLNDHDDLRHERLFGVVLGQLESQHPRCAPLAGKSTLNRLEQSMHVSSDLSDSRYVKMSLNPTAVESLFVELFIEQMGREPKRIILDMDVTDDPTHDFESNQLRLWFSSFADVLMQALRLKTLAHTELADAQFGTIRRKLLKLGAQIRISVRRILVAFSSASPIQAIFQAAY